MDSSYAQRVCELVAGIIFTDGELHAAENRLLARLIKELGLGTTPETVLAPTIAREEAVAAIRDLPAAVREEVLVLLVDAAVVDGKVVPSEQRYLDAVAKAMGVEQHVLDERITERLAKS